MSNYGKGVNSNDVASNIQFDYFLWMVDLVCDKRYTKGQTWKQLLTFLDKVEFSYSIDMDGNRAKDGEQLRYRFGFEKGIPNEIIRTALDCRSCSMLEMMVALSLRCEEHIMADPENGDQTGKWFFEMVESLDLGNMNDTAFDSRYASRCVHRFLRRQFQRDGKGGLFTVQGSPYDMRSLDIWYQMMTYLNVEYERR